MIYRDTEVVVSVHYGSLIEDEHTVFSGVDTPFYRAGCQYGTVYGNTELQAVQGAMQLIDRYFETNFPN